MADKTERLAIIVSAQNKASAALRSVAKDLGTIDRAAVKSAGIAARGTRTAIGNIEKLAMAGAGLALGGGAAAVKWAGDFQAQLNTINTIAMTTPAGLKTIGDSILAMSRKTGIGLDDLTGGYYDLLSAGVKAKDTQALLNDAVTLGVGGLATTQETVNLLSTAYNAYGLDAAGAARATDMFAQAIADGVVHADQIAASFADVASIAKTYHIGIDQVAASYAFLTAKGVPAAEVTTQMQRAILELIKPSAGLKKAAKDLKINLTEEMSKKGLVPTLQEIREYADKAHKPLTDFFGRVEAVKYVLNTTGENAKGFAVELAKIDDSAGTAAKQAAERQQGLNFQLGRLKQEAISAGITIGNELIPTLADLAAEVSDALEAHHGDIQNFATDLGRAFKDAVAWAEKLDLKGIASSIKGAAGFAGALIQHFAEAPPWLQQAVITGWGLNKLSGGAVVDIGATLTKGALGSALGSMSGLFARGASAASPMYVKEVGLGASGGGAGGAGGLGLLKFVGAALLITGAVELLGPLNDTLNFVAQQEKDVQSTWNDFLKTGSTAELTNAMKGIRESFAANPAGALDQDTLHKLEAAFNAEMARRQHSGPDDRGGAQQLPAGFQSAVDSWDTHSESLRIAMAGNEAAVTANTAEARAARLAEHARARAAVGGKGTSFTAFLRTLRTGGAAAALKGFPEELHYLQTASEHTKAGLTYQRGIQLNIAALKRDMVGATGEQKRKLSADIVALQGLLRPTNTAVVAAVSKGAATVAAAVRDIHFLPDGTPAGDKKDWVKYPHDGLTWASGGSGMSRGPARIPGLGVYGEAGNEAFAILRQPQAINGAAGRAMILRATINLNLQATTHLDTGQAKHALYRFQATVLGS